MLNSRRVNNYQNDGFGNYYQNFSFHLYVNKFINENHDSRNNDGDVFERKNSHNCSGIDMISPLNVTNNYNDNNNSISTLNRNNSQGNNSINKEPNNDNNNNNTRNNSNNDDNGESNSFYRLNQAKPLPLISTTKTRQYFSDLRPFTDLLSFNSIFIEITKAFIGVAHPLGRYASRY